MPVMNGLEAAKKLRSLYGAEARTIPIIALSANAFVEDKNRSLEAGMNGHLAKPIDFDLLKKELAKYL
jgi:CheY-like chemotaxis protein